MGGRCSSVIVCGRKRSIEFELGKFWGIVMILGKYLRIGGRIEGASARRIRLELGEIKEDRTHASCFHA